MKKLHSRLCQFALFVLPVLTSQIRAAEITFPVGTPVTTIFSPNYAQYVERDGFRFNKFLGSLSINSINYDGAHPGGGGLYVGAGETSLTMSRLDGQPFGLQSLTILETNNPTGLKLTLGARPHGGLPTDFIEEEFLFDLNTNTYDTFDVAATDPRFASVDYVTFISVESPFVDPSETNFVLDRVVYSFPNPLAGDFDMDNDVDGRDFLEWQRDTNVGDLADWQVNFGVGIPLTAAFTAAEAASPGSVPEPGGRFILGLMSFGCVAFRRPKGSRFLSCC